MYISDDLKEKDKDGKLKDQQSSGLNKLSSKNNMNYANNINLVAISSNY